MYFFRFCSCNLDFKLSIVLKSALQENGNKKTRYVLNKNFLKLPFSFML